MMMATADASCAGHDQTMQRDGLWSAVARSRTVWISGGKVAPAVVAVVHGGIAPG